MTRAVDAVVAAAAETFNVPAAGIMGRALHRAFSEPRQVVMYVLRKHHYLTLVEIGLLMGRNHATVSHAIDTIARRIRTEAAYGKLVDYIAGAEPQREDTIDRAEALLASAQKQMDEALRLLKALAPKAVAS